MMMRNKLRIGFILFIATFNSLFSQLPQLFINEYSAANVSRNNPRLKDFKGDSPDWIELYNNNLNDPIEINGFYLSDNANDKQRYRIPLSSVKVPKISIPPGGYFVIFCSGKDTVIASTKQVHTNFKLTQTKSVAEQLFLSDKNGTQLDNVTIKRNQADHSWGRYYYGDPNVTANLIKNRKFYVYVRPTPGGFNDSNKIGNSKPVFAYIDYLKSPEMTTQPGFRPNGILVNFKPTYSNTDYYWIKYSYTNQIPSRTASAYADTIPLTRTAAGLLKTAYTGLDFDPTTVEDSVYHTCTIKARYVPIDTFAYYYLPSFPITNTFFIKGVEDSIKVGTNKFKLTFDSAQKLPIIHISENKYSNANIAEAVNNGSTPPLPSDINKSKAFRLPPVFGIFANTTADSTYSTLEYFENGKRLGVYNGFTMKKATKKRTANFEQRNIAFKPNDEYGVAPSAVVDGQRGINHQLKHQFFKNPTLSPSTKDKFRKIHLRAAGNDNFFSAVEGANAAIIKKDTVNQTHLRDGMVQSYAAKIGLNFETRNYQPVILYVNGRYNGIYDIRETFNNNFTKANFQQAKKDIDVIKIDAQKSPLPCLVREREGSKKDFVSLCKFILKKDLSDPAYYDTVKTKMSVTSLIDYIIYNQYTGNTHFVNDNVGIWRGRSPDGVKQKWRFFAYDMDNVFQRSANTFSHTGNTATDPYSFSPCAYKNVQEIVPDSINIFKIFKRLYDTNFVFKSQYLFRFNSLLSTSLKCDSMVNHFEKVKGLMTSQIRRHVANNSKNRYNFAGGQQALVLKINRAYDSLREAILRRCVSFDSTLQYTCDTTLRPREKVFVKILPDTIPEIGKVSVYGYDRYTTTDTLTMNHIFMRTRLELEANTTNINYVFDRWTTTNKADTILNSIFSNSMYFKVTKGDTIYANFKRVPKEQLDFPLQFPTAFSPNGDGKNDIFSPIGGSGDIVQYEMQIYNRWGELIYNTYDRNRGWNGKQYGADAPVGVYVFRVTAVDINNKKTNKVGNLTLLR
jgi:gliding motility-associated-like protein